MTSFKSDTAILRSDRLEDALRLHTSRCCVVSCLPEPGEFVAALSLSRLVWSCAATGGVRGLSLVGAGTVAFVMAGCERNAACTLGWLACDTLLLLSFRSEAGEFSLSLESSLVWEDLLAESVELFEYAESRLDIEDTRFISRGVGLKAAGSGTGLRTGFRLMALRAGEGSCELSFAKGARGSAGSGETMGLGSKAGARLGAAAVIVAMPRPCCRDGNGIAGNCGNGVMPSEVVGVVVVVMLVLLAGAAGGAGKAFEKRECPVLGAARRSLGSMVYDMYIVANRCCAR